MPADMKDSIAEAARKLSWMLERNGEKLVDIAEKLCYQNAANLTRSFTREFGMSPSRWLEQQREN